MTTLPQTTPMRLPRPSGSSGQIAIPSAGPAGAHGLAQAGAGMTGADVWRVFRTNWWLIALFVIVAGIAGLFINRYLAQHYPKYTAAALVKVEVAYEVFSPWGDEGAATPQTLEIEQKTQAQGLVAPALLIQVITESDKVRATEWYREFNNDIEAAKEDLLKNFSVQPIQSSRLIKVEMTYKIPKDARTIVEEVVNRYVANERDRYAVNWSSQATALATEKRNLEREYQKVSDRLTNNADGLGNKESFELFGLAEVKRYDVIRITDSLQKADEEYRQADNELRAMQEMIDSGGTPPEVEAEILKYESVRDYQRQLDGLDTQIQLLGGSRSPQAASLYKRRQEVERKAEDEREKLKTAHIDYKRYEITTKKRAAQEAQEALKAKLAKANDDLTNVQAAANRYKQLEQAQHDLKEKIDAAADKYDRIQNQKLTRNWAPVSMFQAPPTPETPSFPKLGVVLGFALMTGLGLSVGIAFLREIMDTTVRSPRDIARVGQLNMLGMIPHESDDPQAAAARLPLVIFDSPHSMAAEEFRKLRTRLQHAASLDSTRSILVSSANPGDGKTTVACNLAAGLALNGRRILLVDANFRRPEIHNLFEVPNEQGLSDALNDLSTFDTLVRDTSVQNLYVMPTGPKPVNATELLESQLLIDFIERALEDYDHVIFDSGPLLVVSETMALAPRVDGVITVVRARTNTRGVLQRMRDMLRQVKAEHLGVVLNAVRSQGGGYYGRNIKTYYAYQNA